MGAVNGIKSIAKTPINPDDDNQSDANEQSLKFNMDDVRAM